MREFLRGDWRGGCIDPLFQQGGLLLNTEDKISLILKLLDEACLVKGIGGLCYRLSLGIFDDVFVFWQKETPSDLYMVVTLTISSKLVIPASTFLIPSSKRVSIPFLRAVSTISL